MNDNEYAENEVNMPDLKDNAVSAEDTDAKNGDVETEKNTAVTEADDKSAIYTADESEFKEFAASYKMRIDDIKNAFSNIINLKKIDKETLENIPEKIYDSLSTKGDVVKYVYYLNEKDNCTYSHSLNVCLLSNVLAKWLDLSDKECSMLSVAALLHDIGKLKISNSVLNKKEKLTDEEFEILKSHSSLGFKMLENINVSSQIKLAVLMHHEKIDGSGYPLGIKGSRISKYARIISICDIYDALTTDRVYRSKICPFDAMGLLEKSGFGKLDTEFLQCFLHNIAYSYLGSIVKLSDMTEAEVVFVNSKTTARPIVKRNNEFINLSMPEYKNIKILDVL